jgi:hypothetical protein
LGAEQINVKAMAAKIYVGCVAFVFLFSALGRVFGLPRVRPDLRAGRMGRPAILSRLHRLAPHRLALFPAVGDLGDLGVGMADGPLRHA